jgi:hypothetical protein
MRDGICFVAGCGSKGSGRGSRPIIYPATSEAPASQPGDRHDIIEDVKNLRPYTQSDEPKTVSRNLDLTRRTNGSVVDYQASIQLRSDLDNWGPRPINSVSLSYEMMVCNISFS